MKLEAREQYTAYIIIMASIKEGDHDHDHDERSNYYERWSYLIVNPHTGGLLDLAKYVLIGDMESAARFVEQLHAAADADHRWVIIVSIVARKVIHVLGKPMEYAGWVVDFLLNLISLNGGLFGIFFKLLSTGEIVIPQRGTETFISTIGQLDGRVDLDQGRNLVQTLKGGSSAEVDDELILGNRGLMDLCIMASKLAYENAQVVTNVVVHHWKMHFVGFYSCWDDYQKENCTQVFLLTDKPKDANLVLVSFRGTEPFDADDWSTDFDYSWYEIPQVGKLHMGFLEALGLGNRADISTFALHLHQNTPVPPEMVERTAYYKVRKELKKLLQQHANAKLVVTGHSLGGALAIMFPTILAVHQEAELMSRLLGVYTFGQPRIGNDQLGRFMEAHLKGGDGGLPKLLRVVYCNDLVPRLPYDDKTFLYKHFGMCLYYNSLYQGKFVDEEPDPNFFGMAYVIPAHANAVWELARSFMLHYIYGPEYREGWFGTLARLIGVALPGVADHCPTDYVNSIRLEQDPLLLMATTPR